MSNDSENSSTPVAETGLPWTRHSGDCGQSPTPFDAARSQRPWFDWRISGHQAMQP
jgi:hypothetical protein